MKSHTISCLHVAVAGGGGHISAMRRFFQPHKHFEEDSRTKVKLFEVISVSMVSDKETQASMLHQYPYSLVRYQGGSKGYRESRINFGKFDTTWLPAYTGNGPRNTDLAT